MSASTADTRLPFPRAAQCASSTAHRKRWAKTCGRLRTGPGSRRKFRAARKAAMSRPAQRSRANATGSHGAGGKPPPIRSCFGTRYSTAAATAPIESTRRRRSGTSITSAADGTTYQANLESNISSEAISHASQRPRDEAASAIRRSSSCSWENLRQIAGTAAGPVSGPVCGPAPGDGPAVAREQRSVALPEGRAGEAHQGWRIRVHSSSVAVFSDGSRPPSRIASR